MNQMMQFENTLTMSSREISELTGKRHPDVRRDIRNMLEALKLDVSRFAHIYKDSAGRDQEEYRLGRELTLTLVSGYDIPLRHKVVLRVAELEQQSALAKFNVPTTYPEAMRLAADLADQRDQAVAKLMIAAPKVEAFDLLKNADGLVCVRDAAKALQRSERKVLIPWLLSHRWMYRRVGSNRLVGHQDKCNIGYLEHKCTTTVRGDGSEKEVVQVLITPKGMARLAEIFSNGSQTELFAA